MCSFVYDSRFAQLLSIPPIRVKFESVGFILRLACSFCVPQATRRLR